MSGADVQRCAARARREAAELGHDSVGTDHLLLALVDEEAPGLLDGLAITPEELRVAVADRRGAGVRRPGAPELLGEAATALDEAVREATRTPEEGIGVEQFLLTLLRGEESAAGQVLARLGCSKDDVERRLAGAR